MIVQLLKLWTTNSFLSSVPIDRPTIKAPYLNFVAYEKSLRCAESMFCMLHIAEPAEPPSQAGGRLGSAPSQNFWARLGLPILAKTTYAS